MKRFIFQSEYGAISSKFTSAYMCLGFVDFQSHYGSAPISIVWKMKESLTGFVMKKMVKV